MNELDRIEAMAWAILQQAEARRRGRKHIALPDNGCDWRCPIGFYFRRSPKQRWKHARKLGGK